MSITSKGAVNVPRPIKDQTPNGASFDDERTSRLFETDPSKCWIDLYDPRSLFPPSTKTTEPRHTGRAEQQQALADIDYLGRCEVPYLRFSNYSDIWGYPVNMLPHRFDVPNICIIRQYHTWSRLLTSRDLFEGSLLIMGFHERVKDFLIPFGLKLEETDIGGPSLWYQLRWDDSRINRKVLGYSCAYTLKYLELNRRPDPSRPWSERQTTIAVEKDSDPDNAVGWLLVSPSSAMQRAMHSRMALLAQGKNVSIFEWHLDFVGCATMNWQPYLAYLTKETTEGANRAIVTSFDADGINTFAMNDRQKLQTIQDRITDMFAMLDNNLDILTSLEEAYHLFELGADSVTLSATRSDPIAFSFHHAKRELTFLRAKLSSLHKRMQATVQLSSSVLELENGSALRKLAEGARQEGVVMKDLAQKSTEDAAAVKVITVITLIYLPLTVVANFFSTDFVHQSSVGAGTRVEVADNWWILVAVSLPLTAVTLLTWWAINKRRMLWDALAEWYARSKSRLMFLEAVTAKKVSSSAHEALP